MHQSYLEAAIPRVPLGKAHEIPCDTLECTLFGLFQTLVRLGGVFLSPVWWLVGVKLWSKHTSEPHACHKNMRHSSMRFSSNLWVVISQYCTLRRFEHWNWKRTPGNPEIFALEIHGNFSLVRNFEWSSKIKRLSEQKRTSYCVYILYRCFVVSR